MVNFIPEYGETLDAATLLTLYYDGEAGGLPIEARDIDNGCVQAIMDVLERHAVTLPAYLFPFCWTQKNGRSFLWSSLLDSAYFSHCVKPRLELLFGNAPYLRQSFLDCCLPSLPPRDRARLWALEHPFTIQVIQAENLSPVAESHLIYALGHFDVLIRELRDLLWVICEEVGNMARSAEGYTAFMDLLTQPTITSQLCRLSGAAEETTLQCSLTMLNPSRVTYCRKEPTLFLVGIDFEYPLKELSRYAEVTPYAFALAVSNPVRYDILNLLSENQRPYTTVEIRQALHISKSAALQALRDMQAQGVLCAEPGKGAAHCYSLDRDAIRHIADQLRQICSK